MITPDFSTFKKLSRKGNLVILTETFPADLETPVSSFLKISKNARQAFLLESAEQGQRVGRYSFLGIDPVAVYQQLRAGTITVTERGAKRTIRGIHLLDMIDAQLKGIRIANPKAFQGFSGGFVGYFSYENVSDFEKIRLSTKKGTEFPRGIFFRVQDFLVFDHFRKTLSIVMLVNLSRSQNLRKAYADAARRMVRYHALLHKPLRVPPSRKFRKLPALKSNMTRPEYEAKVRRIKEYIRAGDCIQVVFSQRFSFPHKGHDFQIYRSLRSINPSPYMFYFRSGTHRLIGSSPEVLVKKTGRMACVRPIAGTRPRGKDEAQDLAYEKQLRNSPKEMAEHLMLVDLGRNDLGRVSDFKSVRVDHFASIERYSHVMHLVSNVTSRLRNGKTAADLLRATFPAGTVSGAPKIRAMQIIDELETESRGPYAGCLGHFGFDGDMNMCITIRTLMLEGSRMYVQAGGGIVKDSDPGREYEETVNKSRAILKAIEERNLF
ncbi:MAG: Anthranilate synthase component 1 [Candidatus Omnitrophica bacterium ADurb.Bin314]|nr:MAG: Anthranilate synthase component 1 [Candidatus Omnitrophica bacterium ADurb.Bin314]